jgi:hypothetical protein
MNWVWIVICVLAFLGMTKFMFDYFMAKALVVGTTIMLGSLNE